MNQTTRKNLISEVFYFQMSSIYFSFSGLSGASSASSSMPPLKFPAPIDVTSDHPKKETRFVPYRSRGNPPPIFSSSHNYSAATNFSPTLLNPKVSPCPNQFGRCDIPLTSLTGKSTEMMGRNQLWHSSYVVDTHVLVERSG